MHDRKSTKNQYKLKKSLLFNVKNIVNAGYFAGFICEIQFSDYYTCICISRYFKVSLLFAESSFHINPLNYAKMQKIEDSPF